MPAIAHATVAVEQLEAEQLITSNPTTFQEYAPVEFGGSPTVAGTGVFAGITFQAVDPNNDTNTFDPTFHAYTVGDDMYGSGTVGNAYIGTVFSGGATDFLGSTVKTYANPGLGVLPGNFSTGVQVVNNSWDGTYNGYPNADLDALRRFDFMVNNQDVLSFAGVNGAGYTTPLLWAAYNTLAVVAEDGSETGFDPQADTTKQHADLTTSNLASFGSATDAGYGVALYGNAQAAGQTSAEHSYVMRSLLLAGADKVDPGNGETVYVHPAAGDGGMDPYTGAGVADYNTSLSILQAGPKNLLAVSSGVITGTPYTVQKGWATGNVSAGTESVVLFQSANAITGITASLNWNVTSETSGGDINTSNGAVIFPNLTFEVCPVTSDGGGKYTLGAVESNPDFQSAVSGDNTQYIYSPTGLPAGTYALLITGDPSLLATVGMSYALAGSFATTWNSSSGGSWGTASLWTNGIPNGQAAQANLLISPGITTPSTITLDGNRIVGQLTFNNSNGYTIAQGTIQSGISGTLTIDDTGDSTGTANPLITVISGSQTISAPVNLIAGITTNISSGSTLTISGVITGGGGITKTGAGTLALSAADAYTTLSSTNTPDGTTTIDGGTLLLTPTGSIDSGPIVVNADGTLNFAPNNTAGILVRTVPGSITINSSGNVVVSPSIVLANRQLLVASGGLSIAGSTNNWTGKLDLSNNDLDVPAGNLAMLTNQIAEGYNGGRWNGAGGIVSSASAANTTHLTTLGIILNSTNGTTPLYGAGTALGTFDGTSPAATDVLIKYTYYGDANLDGSVTASDYSLIDNGYLNHLSGWYNGDFNYDGVINGSDYTLIDNAYNMQGAPITTNTTDADAIATIQIAGTSSVPEPGPGVLLGVGLLSSLGRRLRRNL